LKELLDEVTPLEMEQTKAKMQLAIRIEDCMRSKGWNKSQFAEQVGKNPSEITKWVSGTQNFTIDVLTEIAHALGVELASLLGKPQVQVIYRKEIVVKSAVTVSIPFTTPLGQDADYKSSFFTTQINQPYKQNLTQA
ncbi:MAG TPA: helix-turn-helix transcriptional regulator, partial [Crocinitomicaceae bacterium]|nr:helix-turn-helix transcriptional regulator [Crocinitomicaceae bacterium]